MCSACDGFGIDFSSDYESALKTFVESENTKVAAKNPKAVLEALHS